MSDGSATNGKSSAIDLENTLAQIRGVYASCVVLDSGKGPSEIHIVASTERKPKQIVRDIETLLFVKHRVKVDYRKISLVQLPDEKLLNIPLARPEIRRVTEQVMGNERRIIVEIQGAGKTAAGEAAERLDHPVAFQTSAKATINAIEKLLNNAIDVRLESAETFRLGPREILLVIVTCLSDNGEETFVGASFVGARPVESAARATLDALNRRIYNLSLQAPRQPDVIAQLAE
ncbi:MAG: hypothetical protein M1482_05255 [Chloroflexi bacterium]|nr:hypothetical protein [Chloroflexota bacterium]